MNDYAFLFKAVEHARKVGEPLLEVCITDTDGSTYRKSGARMLINTQGDMTGLITGGCLEGELTALAPELLNNLESRVLEYDMRTANPEHCVMGPGCNGRVRVRLNVLSAQNDYGPLAIIQQHATCTAQLLSAIDDSGDFALTINDSLNLNNEYFNSGNVPSDAEELIAEQIETTALLKIGKRDYLFETIEPPTRLTVFGAAADALLLAPLAEQMGFVVQLLDHRAGYREKAQSLGFSACEPSAPSFSILDSDAIVIMSHDFEQDAVYLKQASKSSAIYIGMMGPVDRRYRLLSKAELDESLLGERLFNPAGLDIGSETSAQIAVSIVAEMMQVLSGRNGQSLKHKVASTQGQQ